MAFPAAIVNEPPPCVSSEDEDSEEFRSHGLKLDVPSGDPTPVTTPLKRPALNVTNNEATIANNNSVDSDVEVEDIVLEVISALEESPTEVISQLKSQVYSDEDADISKQNGTISPESANKSFVASEEEELCCQPDEAVANRSNDETSSNQSSEDIDGPTATSASEPDAANKICDNTANISDPGDETLGHCECGDSSSRSEEGKDADIGDNHHKIKDEEDDIVVRQKVEIAEVDVPGRSPQKELDSEVEVQSINQNEVESPPPELCDSPHGLNVASASFASEYEDVGTNVERSLHEDDEDEFGDFGAFQSIPKSSEISNNEGIDAVTHSLSTKQSMEVSDDEDDDFGDFAQVPVQTVTSVSAQASSSKPSAQDTEDFADFQDCSFQSCETPAFTSASSSPALISSKVNSLIKSLFVAESTIPETEVVLKSIDSEISISNDETWARVQDFEGSQGLMFKWLNSLTEKRLLRSLNVDNSNIMYHEKWGTIEVPKFAASLVMSPLQPESCSSPNMADLQSKADTRNVTVNNNNIKEGISCENQDKPPSISAEAQEILRQLPDLSYMRANTLVFPQMSPSGI